MLFVKLFGKSTLGLAYGLSAAETLIAPAMPSTTARAGGVFMPIINSLSLASGSEPGELRCQSTGPPLCGHWDCGMLFVKHVVVRQVGVSMAYSHTSGPAGVAGGAS